MKSLLKALKVDGSHKIVNSFLLLCSCFFIIILIFNIMNIFSGQENFNKRYILNFILPNIFLSISFISLAFTRSKFKIEYAFIIASILACFMFDRNNLTSEIIFSMATIFICSKSIEPLKKYYIFSGAYFLIVVSASIICRHGYLQIFSRMSIYFLLSGYLYYRYHRNKTKLKNNIDFNLTDEQMKIAVMICDKLSRQEIASDLKISVRTVNRRIEEIRLITGDPDIYNLYATLRQKLQD